MARLRVRRIVRKVLRSNKAHRAVIVSSSAAMAPVGRPPVGHKFVDGGWVHEATGAPYDAQKRAAAAHARKLACLRKLYWERGGRQKRLDRYVRKRKPKLAQLTLEHLLAPPERSMLDVRRPGV